MKQTAIVRHNRLYVPETPHMEPCGKDAPDCDAPLSIQVDGRRWRLTPYAIGGAFDTFPEEFEIMVT